MQLTDEENRVISQFTNKELGAWGETKAVAYLESLGMKIVQRNWRCRYGEIDIVAFEPRSQALLAVEVKTRRTVQAGTPEEAITFEKLRRLKILILEWIDRRSGNGSRFFWNEIKVQVIAIDIHGQEYAVRYLRQL